MSKYSCEKNDQKKNHFLKNIYKYKSIGNCCLKFSVEDGDLQDRSLKSMTLHISAITIWASFSKTKQGFLNSSQPNTGVFQVTSVLNSPPRSPGGANPSGLARGRRFLPTVQLPVGDADPMKSSVHLEQKGNFNLQGLIVLFTNLFEHEG